MKTLREAKRKQEQRRRLKYLKPLFFLCAFFLCLFLCLGIFHIAKKGITTLAKTFQSPNESLPKAETKDLVITTSGNLLYQPVDITVSLMGDCTLGTDESFNRERSLNAYYDKHGASYFLEHVKGILSEDDLSVVNMEGTLTEETQRADKKFAFKGPTEYAQILAEGSVEAANMANNHSADYGKKSYTDTMRALSDTGILTFGYDDIAYVTVKDIKVALIGIYELKDHMGRQKQLTQNIEMAKEENAQLIIVNFHWGEERKTEPTDTQKKLAHHAIDSGADLVVGHHPHVLQGIEKYKERYIAYSLGNFCFGGNSNPEDKDTMIFQQTFTIRNDGVDRNDNIRIIPCSISSSSEKNDYRPTPASGAEKNRILEKIESYSNKL